PMFVAVQGPQGSGKTHLTRSLVSSLSSPPHSLRFAVFSVDDLYLTCSARQRLAADNQGNKLWSGRGQPGTHDVQLGADVLKLLRDINVEQAGEPDVSTKAQVVIPNFDKSKYDGLGDRSTVGTPVNPPIDVVILEGWCVGFYPLEDSELDEQWETVCSKAEATPGSIIQRAMEGIRKEDIETVNVALRGYVKEWYGFFEVFVQIQSPPHLPYEYIYTWRLEQEHNMKASNGGIGMTDEQVISFVDRFIPGYIFFGHGVKQGASVEARPPWVGNGLCVTIGEEREVLETELF
ncbi:P-loop containing nucleoside triphosphate hydrolase protein, partial [Gautieria morchelliformis]